MLFGVLLPSIKNTDFFFFSFSVTITREEMNTGNRVVHTTRHRADPRWIWLVPILFHHPVLSLLLAESIMLSSQHCKMVFCKNVTLQAEKKEQLLQSLSSKVLNYNEKSNNLIWSGQKSFRSDICPLLWHEGWFWSFKKNLSSPASSLTLSKHQVIHKHLYNWKR